MSAVKSKSTNKPQDIPQPVSISTSTSLAVINSKSTSKLDTLPSVSTPLLVETPKQIFPQPVSHSLSLNKQLPNQIMSMLTPCKQSPLMFPMSLEPCSYNITLQQKLQATKQKLKRSNNKQKIETKRSTTNKDNKYKTDANQLSNGRSKKYSSKINELKLVRNQKSPNISKLVKPSKSASLEFNKTVNILLDKSKPYQYLDSVVEINNVHHNTGNTFCEATSSSLKPNKTSFDKLKTSVVKQTATSGTAMSNVKSSILNKVAATPHNPKSVYIDLDSAAEQARLKSTLLHNKNPDKKNTAPVSLNPAMLLSSCPGLSITPVVNTNDNMSRKATNEQSTSRLVQNTPTSKNFNFEHLQQLGNSLTITKSEKNGNKNQTPELIIID